MTETLIFLTGYVVGGATATLVLIGAFIDKEEKKKNKEV